MIGAVRNLFSRSAPEAVQYGGHEYRRYPKSKQASQRRYYRRYAPEGVVMLHRQMWIDAHGPIPAGLHVHHKDHNYGHNKVKNFELQHPGVHLAAHPEQTRRIQRYAGRGTLGVRVKRRIRSLFNRKS